MMIGMIACAACAGLVSLPFLLGGGALALASEMLVLVATAQSWNLLVGCCRWAVTHLLRSGPTFFLPLYAARRIDTSLLPSMGY